jgi:hypothetical protein
MFINVAKKCFKENLELFGNSKTQPEKFNLYKGLTHLADEIGDLHKEIDKLQRELKRARQDIQSLRSRLR